MSYAEVVVEAGVNVVRRDEAFWLTESDWCFKKVFHTVFDVLVTWTFFVSNSVCFWKKDLKIKAERIRNHWRQKRVVFQKTFWTSPRKTGNFEGILFFLCLVNEMSRQSFPNNYRSVETKFILSKEALKTVNEFAFCLLIGQIGSSFFLWKKCFVSHLFFASQRNSGKSNNETFRLGKN